MFLRIRTKISFDTIETIDILDANAGDHGYPLRQISIKKLTYVKYSKDVTGILGYGRSRTDEPASSL